MLFNSLEFAVFFPVVCVLYFIAPYRWQTGILLIASCVFYMAFIPHYILILFATIVIDYFAGLYLEKVQGRPRTIILWVSIIATCAILFVFKYFYFFAGVLAEIANALGYPASDPILRFVLPIGLSFHTFQSLSYVIEVYRGHQKAEKSFVVYATYVMFFPQLVAGPIERPQNLLHQFHEEHRFDYRLIAGGLKLMAWGFFKKLVIADRLALYVNDIFSSPSQYNGLQLSLGTVFFAYQIYCDFSGYSDIARGSARILGFELMKNFNDPYASSSISEFWRRWHISLSTWFRDYIYIPLGGSRSGGLKKCRNLIITFTISGLWHGAAWTYVVWGFLNGIYLVFESFTQTARDRFFSALGVSRESAFRLAIRTVSTFLLTCIGWVVFRSQSLSDGWYILTHFYKDWHFGAISTPQFLLRQMPIAIGAVCFLELAQAIVRWKAFSSTIRQLHMAHYLVRFAGYSIVVVIVIMFGVYRSNQFIYFQF